MSIEINQLEIIEKQIIETKSKLMTPEKEKAASEQTETAIKKVKNYSSINEETQGETLENRLEALEIYYEHPRKEYYLYTDQGKWCAYNQGQIKRKLKKRGFSQIRDDQGMSEIDHALEYAEDKKSVDYASPIAGKTKGYYKENNIDLLVTDSPKIIKPAKGDCPLITEILKGLFVNQESLEIGKKQITTFCLWLKYSIECLQQGKRNFAQALAIAGQAGCGKSLIQHLLTEILGGRGAKASKYFQGKTNFNADLCQAEHLMIEDDYCSSAIKDRLAFGSMIKNATVSSELVSCEGKHRNPVAISPFWRISITLNDNPESLNILPPLNEDTQDKIIILKASKAEMPMPTQTAQQKEDFRRALSLELPAFIDYLLNLKIPKSYIDQRYSVKTWHHPELVKSLLELSPEYRMLELMATALANYKGNAEMTATEIRDHLLDHPQTEREASKLLPFAKTSGTYLSRLASSKSDKISNRLKDGKMLYTYKKI